MRRPVQPESAMRGDEGIRADIAPRKENGWKRGKGVGAGCHRGHERLRDSHRQASTIIRDMKAKVRGGRKGQGRERVFRQR